MSALFKCLEGRLGLDARDLRCDEVFAYEAPKTVRIRNAYIGIFDIIIKLSILGYMIFNLWTGKGLTIFESIASGAQEASIMDLYELPSDEIFPGGNYHGLGAPGCKSFKTCERDPATYTYPPYCGTNEGGLMVNDTADALPCLFWSSGKAPVKESESTIFLTSRVTMTDWSEASPAGCEIYNNWNESCFFNTTDHDSKFYIPDVEHYSIRMSHSVRGQKIKAAGSTLCKGTMEGTNLTFLRSDYDYFRISDLLSAAGLGKSALDKLHDLHKNMSDSPELNRYTGLNIFVEITYFTPDIFRPHLIEYKYKVTSVDMMGATLKEHFYTENGTKRMTQKRAGIRITFDFNGLIEQFDVLSSLMTIVVGLGMWAVSGVIINLIVTRISSDKDIYKHYLYDNTQDFSELHALERTQRDKMESVRTFARERSRHGDRILEEYEADPLRFQPTPQSEKMSQVASVNASSTA
eukprot:m.191537 g.191537  ORF g.191537 m.191537 type:complete len:465 (-) comp32435_c0_seq1:190-1584(-)